MDETFVRESTGKKFERSRAIQAAEFFGRGFYGWNPTLAGDAYRPPAVLAVIGSAVYSEAVNDLDLLAIVTDSRIKTPDDLDVLVEHVKRFEQIERAYRVRQIQEEPIPVDFLPVSSLCFTDGRFGDSYRKTFLDPGFLKNALSRGALLWNYQKRKFVPAGIGEVLSPILEE